VNESGIVRFSQRCGGLCEEVDYAFFRLWTI